MYYNQLFTDSVIEHIVVTWQLDSRSRFPWGDKGKAEFCPDTCTVVIILWKLKVSNLFILVDSKIKYKIHHRIILFTFDQILFNLLPFYKEDKIVTSSQFFQCEFYQLQLTII